jgi:carbonic anhydrase/acetyltransferase-like protein (isoleucine patch superfamily)
MNIPSGTFPDPEKVIQNIKSHPAVAPTAFIAPGATVVGNVTLAEETSVWFNTTLRGDIHRIQVGAHSNIQDGAVVHVADLHEAIIGEWVTVGHNAIVHACTVEDEVLIGMGATILDGARIGTRSIVGAGALVTGNTVIPPGSLVLGSPAKVARMLTEDEQSAIKSWAERYVALSRIYLQEAEQETR